MNLSNTDKVAIFSDLHLGVHNDSQLWHNIAKEWVKWFRDELNKKNIDTILFLGDVFHCRSDIAVDTLQVASDVFQALKEFNIIIVVGNHDSHQKHSTDINSVSIFKEWSNIKVISNIETLKINNKDCTFINWGANTNNLSKCDFIFGHLEMSSFKMNNYKVCEKGTSPSQLLQICPHIYSGHFHHRNEREYPNGFITYVGNPFEMDISDIDNSKGYYILDLNTNKHTFCENTISPKHLKIKISEYNENINVNNLLVRLLVDKKMSVDEVDKIVYQISKNGPLQLSVEYLINEHSNNIDVKCDLSSIDRCEAIKEFINLIDIENKTELINLCQEIYKTLE